MNKPCEKAVVMEILAQSVYRVTPLVLIKTIVKKTGIPSLKAKKLLKKLTAEKELAYTYFFGSTYIELSFNKSVKITENFILTPAGMKKTGNENHINIFMHQGISFGSGRHPTTRLSLKALDHVVKHVKLKFNVSDNKPAGLDIGTGSGVLAIAACKTLVSHCLALDIDQNSLAEAKKNALLNKLENKIKVSDRDIFALKEKFSLILANLRYPTLKKLCNQIKLLSVKGSVLIMSGIRESEKNELITTYANRGFKLLWKRDEKNWSSVAMEYIYDI